MIWSDNTRQTIMAGIVIASVTGLGTFVYTKNARLDAHEVRISQLELGSIESGTEVKDLASQVTSLRVEAATVVTMLTSLSKSTQQLERTTTELGKIVAKLDERTSNKVN